MFKMNMNFSEINSSQIKSFVSIFQSINPKNVTLCIHFTFLFLFFFRGGGMRAEPDEKTRKNAEKMRKNAENAVEIFGT